MLTRTGFFYAGISANMTKPRAIDYYVVLVSLLAAGSLAIAWGFRLPFPGVWALASLITVACLLDQRPTELRVSATGSLSFVIHIASAALFGAFWGALVAGSSTAISLTFQRKEFKKIVFNTAQRALSVSVAVFLYQVILDGGIPPAYLTSVGVSPAEIQRDLLLFFVMAATYVFTNFLAVSGAVSLSSGRPFREVWHLNYRGLLGYDVGTSVVALLTAWVYQKAADQGFAPAGLLLVVLPLLVVRHVYAMYHALQVSGQELLQVMVKAIEARDPYTSGHSLRVRELSRAMALELELSAKDIEEVETAALLHDVGKIHEEFAPLLRKDTRLTPEETALMQSHAMKSADLVGIISKFRGGVQRAVKHHHERWDGEGYPDGLQGEDIPLGARIILIADTIDAMTTDRPYRKRLSLDAVIAELQKCRGTQFDADLVDVAISSVNVRRLIAGVTGSVPDTEVTPRSMKVRVSNPFWRARRAL